MCTKKNYTKRFQNLEFEFESMFGGSLVTIAWHILRLWMEGSPPVTEDSCEYIE
jgi:hypothetical protein